MAEWELETDLVSGNDMVIVADWRVLLMLIDLDAVTTSAELVTDLDRSGESVCEPKVSVIVFEMVTDFVIVQLFD